jgi:hypothetical protein
VERAVSSTGGPEKTLNCWEKQAPPPEHRTHRLTPFVIVCLNCIVLFACRCCCYFFLTLSLFCFYIKEKKSDAIDAELGQLVLHDRPCRTQGLQLQITVVICQDTGGRQDATYAVCVWLELILWLLGQLLLTDRPC